MTQWKKLLHTLGFSDSESLIYLTSLEMGPTPVQDIAKKARVSRVTTYAVIESLTHQGLMSHVEKGKKRLFMAESPERLVAFVSSRVKEMESTLKEIQSSIDELKLIQRGEKPIVKMYEGPEALKAIETDIVQSRPTTIDEFYNLDVFRQHNPTEQRTEFLTFIKKLRPKARSIMLVKGTKPVVLNPNIDVVEIPDEAKIHFTGGIVTYAKNKVALSSMKGKQISVIIESEEIAETMKAMFDYFDYLRKK